MILPKIAHRIWFGEPLPEKYYENLRNLRELNSDYVIKLWFDPTILSSNGLEEITRFCEKYSIKLCNIRNVPDLLNYDLILEELEASRMNVSHRRLHYVRASDIARIAILEKEGGLYTDTDTIMKKPLFDLPAKHGFLLKTPFFPEDPQYFNRFKVADQHASYQYYFPKILYDFFAFAPHHILLTTAAKITRLDYDTYRQSKYRTWEKSNIAAVLRCGTIILTGEAIGHALNFLYQNGNIVFNDPQDIFLNISNLAFSSYDKSWLEGFGKIESMDNISVDEKIELEAFAQEIDSKRLLSYPIKDDNMHPELEDDQVTNGTTLFNNHPSMLHLTAASLPIPDTESLPLDCVSQSILPEIAQPKYELSAHVEPEAILPEVEQPKYNLSEHVEHEAIFPKIELPKFDLAMHVDLERIKAKLLTRERIYETYKRNNGGLLAKFSIFALNPNSTPSELIQILQERSATSPDPNSASRKTLQELGEDVPPLRNGNK